MLLIKPGQLVTSTAGRDKGSHYLVFKVFENRWLFVVDGGRRTMKKPKRKSIRHVWVSPRIDERLRHKFESGLEVANDEIQSALTKLVRSEEEVGRPNV